MKTLPVSNTFQKAGGLGVWAVGYVISRGLVVALVLAWALTGPLFQFGEWITNNEKLKKGKL